MKSAAYTTPITSKPDSSRSKIYLTPHNYHGPRLLTIIKKRDDLLSEPNAAEFVHITGIMKSKQREEDINALPLSSEDEGAAQPDTTPKYEDTARRSSPKRRSEPANAARSSKRRKLQDEPQLETREGSDQKVTTSLGGTANNADPFDMFSSGSQSQSMKSKRKGYKSRANTYKPFEEPLTHQVNISAVTDLPSSPEAPRSDRPGTLQAAQLNIEEPLTVKVTAHESVHLVDFESDYGSSAASLDQKAVIFDLPDLPESPKTYSRQGLESVSSLTSDNGDDRNGVKEPAEPNNPLSIIHIPPTEAAKPVTCPVCHNSISEPSPVVVPTDLSKLSFQQQRDFCYKHRLHDANLLWSARHYPTINWSDLEHNRIQTHIPHLKSVLSRKSDSYYLSIVDSKIADSKGRNNRKALRTYLLEGIIDIAKTGYYGPRGNKIMLQTVTQTLSKELSKAVQRDEAVRMAGVGPFVTAVLVPELTMRLVMEDLGITDQDEARRVLGESNDIGMLLNADDDLVEVDDDDDC